MKSIIKLRPRIQLPRNLVVTQVAPMTKGKGSFNRNAEKRKIAVEFAREERFTLYPV
jgi:stalled ribosome alternative rescue factor ArfA